MSLALNDSSRDHCLLLIQQVRAFGKLWLKIKINNNILVQASLMAGESHHLADTFRQAELLRATAVGKISQSTFLSIFLLFCWCVQRKVFISNLRETIDPCYILVSGFKGD